MKNGEKFNEERQDDIESLRMIQCAGHLTGSNRNNLNQKSTNGKLSNSEVIFQSDSTVEKLDVVGRTFRCF